MNQKIRIFAVFSLL